MNTKTKRAWITVLALCLCLAMFAAIGCTPDEPEQPETPSAIAVTPATLNMETGDTQTLTVTNASGTVTWTSANEAVASVSDQGVVTAVGMGKTTVTARDASGASATCAVTVTEPAVPVLSVTLDTKTTTIYVDGEYPLTATVLFGSETVTSGAEVKFSSSDPEVASVNETTGTVKGLKTGSATITVTVSYEGQSATDTCELEVTMPSELDILNDSVVLNPQGEKTLEYSAKFIDGDDQAVADIPVADLSFESGDEKVFTVDNTGKITAVAKGSATLRLAYEKGGKEAFATVSVIEEKILSTKEDIIALDYQDVTGDYVLANDIDMEQTAEFNGMKSFQGKFYGNGHTISNVRIVENMFEAPLRNYSFFGYIKSGSVVQNLEFKNFSMIADRHNDDVNGIVNTLPEDARYVVRRAPFADTIDNSTISNIVIQGSLGGDPRWTGYTGKFAGRSMNGSQLSNIFVDFAIDPGDDPDWGGWGWPFIEDGEEGYYGSNMDVPNQDGSDCDMYNYFMVNDANLSNFQRFGDINWHGALEGAADTDGNVYYQGVGDVSGLMAVMADATRVTGFDAENVWDIAGDYPELFNGIDLAAILAAL